MKSHEFNESKYKNFLPQIPIEIESTKMIEQPFAKKYLTKIIERFS